MAVYTPITAPEIAAFLSGFDLGDYVRHEGIMQGVENTNYHLFTSKDRYILTIFEKRIDPADLPFVFSFKKHLSEAGIPVPDVLATGTLAEKPAAIIRYLGGGSIDDADINAAHCAGVGTVLARMHKAAETFEATRANPVGFPQWQCMYRAVRDRAELKLALQIETALDAYTPFDDLPRGAVHADLFPDNVFFEGDTLTGVIDFYFACTDTFVYDMAATMNAWCFDKNTGVALPEKITAFTNAYEAVRPLSAAEKAAFPALRRAAALRFLMTRLYDWAFTAADAQVTKKDPLEYARKLEAECPWP